ncbi:TonB-dependent receptor [uncultured Odoribacter sp.]|uniref:TonB-dependent receptor n=1 Tax=uncultured Odoribacter sp. TaxID=876416 RepID=UPI00260E17DA|nr:TonB-dependent receptor [uncultured Odoribacter sp.]
MNKKIGLTIALLGVSYWAVAENEAADTLRHIQLEEVQVLATRATTRTPIAFVNLNKENIKKQNVGLDLPFLLTMTPSVLTTTDAGSGIGYTGVRIRGTDATRINVTANGIPMNDAESHSIFWVNTPDLASSLQDIQIQRGAGTSTNGAGAFGGSINMQTENAAPVPYAELNGSYGSFNTQRETVKTGTGLLHNRWAFDLRLSHIASDGYRDRASAKLKSYFAQAGYYGERTIVKLITFSGREETYHAWDGIPRQTLDTNRTYNPNGKIENEKGEVIGFYKDQLDVYRQTHYQLLFNHIFNPEWNLNIAFHYTNGKGYYQEYKNKRSLVEYGLKPYEIPGLPEPVKRSDLIRKKNVASDFGGMVFSLNYHSDKLQMTWGGGVHKYVNNHDGNVIWVKNYIGDVDPDHRFYDNTGRKLDANVYGRINYELVRSLYFYADLQYRYIRYTIRGINDKWDWNAGHMQPLDLNETFRFFNPKTGLFYQINEKNSMYISFAVAQKEPTRNNYTDGFFTELPKAECLSDYEFGYNFRSSRFSVGINLYYMDYRDQLVLTGQLNEIGEAVSANVKESYRTGAEFSAGVRFADWLHWDVNATYSRNRIKHYTEYMNDVDLNWNDLYTEEGKISQTTRYLGSSPISFSPDFMLNSLFSFQHKGWNASFQSQYVSKQYLNNSGDKTCTLDAYFVNNLNLSYTFKLPLTQAVTLGISVYNLFDEEYESNGYASCTAVYPSTDGTKPAGVKPEIISYAAYYPNAGINALAYLTFRF